MQRLVEGVQRFQANVFSAQRHLFERLAEGQNPLAEATRRIIEENYQHLSGEIARQTAAVEENVLVQLDNLKTHPAVAAALARKQLNLHGWVYEFETGKVFAFDTPAGQFMPIENLTSVKRAHPREIDI